MSILNKLSVMLEAKIPPPPLFKLGDRVKVKSNYLRFVGGDDYQNDFSNDVGTVLCSAPIFDETSTATDAASHYYGIEWDKFSNGGNLSGHKLLRKCKRGHGWFVNEKFLMPAAKEGDQVELGLFN